MTDMSPEPPGHGPAEDIHDRLHGEFDGDLVEALEYDEFRVEPRSSEDRLRQH